MDPDGRGPSGARRRGGTVIPLQRQEHILNLVERKGTVSLAEIIDALPVSHMTVRRDIKKLEEEGRVVTVHGGITLPVKVNLDLAHRIKRELRSEAKTGIAHGAAGRVREGDHIFLDAGTTTLAIAGEILKTDTPASYITNDLVIAGFLAEHSHKQIYFVGGRVDSANLSTEGYGAAEALGRHNIDLAFISTSSFDLRGISVTSEEKLVFKEAVIRGARQSLLVTDSSKYGKVAPFRAAALSRFSEVHCDDELSATAIEGMRGMGVDVVLSSADAIDGV